MKLIIHDAISLRDYSSDEKIKMINFDQLEENIVDILNDLPNYQSICFFIKIENNLLRADLIDFLSKLVYRSDYKLNVSNKQLYSLENKLTNINFSFYFYGECNNNCFNFIKTFLKEFACSNYIKSLKYNMIKQSEIVKFYEEEII